MEFKDNKGNVLLTAQLPKGYTCKAELQIIDYPKNRDVKVNAEASKDGCTFFYGNGDAYLYRKYSAVNYYMSPEGTQNESGTYISRPTSLSETIDSYASQIAKEKLTTDTYYDVSETLAKKLNEQFQENFKITIDDFQKGLYLSPIPIGVVFRNYLNDAAVGVYEHKGKIIAVYVYRNGYEVDMVPQMSGFVENITGEPFGQAALTMNAAESTATWRIFCYSYMVSDKKEDLNDFLTFIETCEYTKEVKDYAERIRQEVSQRQMKEAELYTMQTQAEINMLNAAQQQRFAAMDRLSASLSQDMDNWRNNLNATMAQNDARFNLGSSSSESLDDRIQRMRHESMMGVETYQRSDGTTVEFDNRADRVFENNLDNTTHFGTEHYYGDYIPDGWHEMKKK